MVDRAARRRASLHASALFVALFGFAGAHLAFWPLWLTDWGLTASEAGAYTAIGIAARIVSGSIIPVIADRLAARRLAVFFSGTAAAGLFLFHGWVETREGLLAVTMLAVGFSAGIFPLGEALGATAAQRFGFAFGPARAAGSAAFLGASIAVGYLITEYGIDSLRWWVAAACLLVAISALGHPGGGAKIDRPRFADIGRLCTRRVVLLFGFAVAAGQASHAVLYALGSIHWRALGSSEAFIGWLWGASSLVEILLLTVAGTWAVRKLGPTGAVMLGGALGIVRWTAMCFDPSGVLLLAPQTLHAATFGLTHLGMIAFISERLPERFSGSAQALMTQFVGGLFFAGGIALASWSYPSLGGATYMIGAFLSGLSFVICLVLIRSPDGQSGKIIVSSGPDAAIP